MLRVVAVLLIGYQEECFQVLASPGNLVILDFVSVLCVKDIGDGFLVSVYCEVFMGQEMTAVTNRLYNSLCFFFNS